HGSSLAWPKPSQPPGAEAPWVSRPALRRNTARTRSTGYWRARCRIWSCERVATLGASVTSDMGNGSATQPSSVTDRSRDRRKARLTGGPDGTGRAGTGGAAAAPPARATAPVAPAARAPSRRTARRERVESCTCMSCRSFSLVVEWWEAPSAARREAPRPTLVLVVRSPCAERAACREGGAGRAYPAPPPPAAPRWRRPRGGASNAVERVDLRLVRGRHLLPVDRRDAGDGDGPDRDRRRAGRERLVGVRARRHVGDGLLAVR